MVSYVTAFIDLSQKPFILHPHPQKDELLSSWLVRVSLAHDTMPTSFMNMHFPKYKNIIFSRDIDVWAPEDFLQKLAWKSGYTYEQIYNLTLKSYIGILLPKFNPSGCNKYFTYIKIRGRSNRLYGQRFCFECLKEDEIPYFRKEWRLKVITKCKKHRIDLSDRCYLCKKPISIYKFNKKDEGHTKCWYCGSRLSNSYTKGIGK